MKVIGRIRRTGEYQGFPYDNINVHCINPVTTEAQAVGTLSEVLKIGIKSPARAIAESLMPGDEINPVYNRSGKVCDITIISRAADNAANKK